MRPTLTLTALLALIVGPLFAADSLSDWRKDSNGKWKINPANNIRVRETKDKTDPSGVVVLLSDSSVRLTRADAQRLADLLNQASEDGSEPSARAKAPWLHLVADKQPVSEYAQYGNFRVVNGYLAADVLIPGMSQCGPGGCSVPRRPAAADPGRSRPTACGDCNSCGSAAPGYSRPRFARRVLGRVFGGRCCR